MRRVIATVVGTVIALVLLLSYKTHHLSSSNAAIAPPALTTPSSGGDPSAQPSLAPSAAASDQPEDSASAPAPRTTTPKAAAPTTSKKAPTTAKRVVQGDAEDTRYGPVQVQVTLTGGKITDIGILQVPQREQRDIEINSYAVPILQQETLQAQSSQIDMVSGATYTSQGYIQSLQSALDKANKTG